MIIDGDEFVMTEEIPEILEKVSGKKWRWIEDEDNEMVGWISEDGMFISFFDVPDIDRDSDDREGVAIVQTIGWLMTILDLIEGGFDAALAERLEFPLFKEIHGRIKNVITEMLDEMWTLYAKRLVERYAHNVK